uniref:Uncharacterized protein n=1 Tax=Arundo donax TaxID=35708 RepID=A0A0A9F7F1_ARUDO
MLIIHCRLLRYYGLLDLYQVQYPMVFIPLFRKRDSRSILVLFLLLMTFTPLE